MAGFKIKQEERIVVIDVDEVMALDKEERETIKFLIEIGFAPSIKRHRANSSSVKKAEWYKEHLSAADFKTFEEMRKDGAYFKACAWAKEHLLEE